MDHLSGSETANDPVELPDDMALVRDGYDALYGSGPNSVTLERLWLRHATGGDFPTPYSHISFLTLDEARGMAAASGLSQGDHLVDLACGAGGPGLLVAAMTGCRLTGIDLSPAGVAQAEARSERVGLSSTSRFAVGTFEATGLPSRCADAVMTVDAIQYSLDKSAALAEMARILRPGGRLLLCGFEVEPSLVAGFPVLGLDPIADYRPLLRDAGFEVVSYTESADWHDRLLAAYQAVLDEAEALTEEMGEQGYAPLALEASSTLGFEPYRSRVLVVATRRL